MTVTVEIKAKASNRSTWIEVTYSGLEPPMALFEDLAMVGWVPPAIPPPPASAIDWNRPDPNTGQTFTIADYLVERAVIDSPRGSGPLGRWTEADRRAHFSVLDGVLKRHDLLDQVKDGRAARAEPVAVLPVPAPPPPVPLAGPRVAPVTPPDTEPTARPAGEPVEGPPAPGTVRISTTVTPASEAAMATALATIGVRSLTFTPVHRTIVHRYRGAESEQRVLDHLQLDALTTTALVNEVRAAITRAAVATYQPEPIITELAGPITDEEQDPAPLIALPPARSA
jgi:hypothetical protein